MFNNNNNDNNNNNNNRYKKKYFDKKSYYQKRKSKLQLEAEKEKEKENQYYRKKVIQQLISFDFNYPPVDPNEGRISVENRKKNKDSFYNKKIIENVSINTNKKQKQKTKKLNSKYKKFFKIRVKKGYKFYRIPSNNKKLLNKIKSFIKSRHKRTNKINQYISNKVRSFNFSKLYKTKKLNILFKRNKIVSPYFFFRNLSNDKVLEFKKKIIRNQISENKLKNNFNLFYFYNILNLNVFSLKKLKSNKRSYINKKFYYAQKKYFNQILIKYYNLLNKSNSDNLVKLFSNLEKLDFYKFHKSFLFLRVLPLSHLVNKDKLYNKINYNLFISNLRKYFKGIKRLKRFRKDNKGRLRIKNYNRISNIGKSFILSKRFNFAKRFFKSKFKNYKRKQKKLLFGKLSFKVKNKSFKHRNKNKNRGRYKNNNLNKNKFYYKKNYHGKNKYYRRKKQNGYYYNLKRKNYSNYSFQRRKKLFIIKTVRRCKKKGLKLPSTSRLIKLFIKKNKKRITIRRKRFKRKLKFRFRKIYKKYYFLQNFSNNLNNFIKLSYAKFYKKTKKLIYDKKNINTFKLRSKYFPVTYSYYSKNRHYRNQSKLFKRYSLLKLRLLKIKRPNDSELNQKLKAKNIFSKTNKPKKLKTKNNLLSKVTKYYKLRIKKDLLNNFNLNKKLFNSVLVKNKIKYLNRGNVIYLLNRKFGLSKKKFNYFNNNYLFSTYIRFNNLKESIDLKKKKIIKNPTINLSSNVSKVSKYIKRKIRFLFFLVRKFSRKTKRQKELLKRRLKHIRSKLKKLKYLFRKEVTGLKKDLKAKRKISIRSKKRIIYYFRRNYIIKIRFYLRAKSFFMKKYISTLRYNSRINNNLSFLRKFIIFYKNKISLENLRAKKINKVNKEEVKEEANQQTNKEDLKKNNIERNRNKTNVKFVEEVDSRERKLYLKLNNKIKFNKKTFNISKYINTDYKNKINSYIYTDKLYNFNLGNIINSFRKKNIFISIIRYYPKKLYLEISNNNNKDYIYAYWNTNSLYFKFIGFLVREGKKHKAEIIFNNSLSFVKEFILSNPIFFFLKSIYNSQPMFEYVKSRQRYKTFVNIRITPSHKRMNLAMRQLSKNIRNSELLRKFKKSNKQRISNSYILYYLLTSSFFVKGEIKSIISKNIENAYSKRHSFRKGNLADKEKFKYSKLLKFLSFRKIRGYHFS